jgi:hypothetical protein
MSSRHVCISKYELARGVAADREFVDERDDESGIRTVDHSEAKAAGS